MATFPGGNPIVSIKFYALSPPSSPGRNPLGSHLADSKLAASAPGAGWGGRGAAVSLVRLPTTIRSPVSHKVSSSVVLHPKPRSSRKPMSSLLRGWGEDLGGLCHGQMVFVTPFNSHFQRIRHTSSSPRSLSTFCPRFHHSLVYETDTCPFLFGFPDFIAVVYCPLLFYCCCFMVLKELSAILVGFQEGAVISE